MTTPAWLETLDQRVAQRTDRASVVLYILAIWPVLAILWLLQWAPMLNLGAAQAFDARWWPVLQAGHGAVLLWMALWALWLWPRRLDPAPDALAVQAVLLPTMLGLVILALGMGIKDTPMGMFLLITFVVGRGLFSMAQMRVGLWACLVLMLAHEAAQLLDWLPYAFLLHRPVYVGEALTPWWSLWLRLTALLALLPLSGVLFLLAWLLQRRQRALKSLVLSDALTGLANRRHFRAVLEREIDRVTRSGEAALLLMLDIDHFKKVNDTHGHLAGDIVLQSVARTLSACVRPMDTLARYGGEEFAVVLPACQAGFGSVVAERIRRAVANTPIKVSGSVELHVTVSIGGAFALQWIRSTTLLWTDRADHQLYQAKAAGRNRVSIEEQPDSTVSAEEKSLLFGPLYTPSGWGDLPPVDPNPTGSAY